MALAHFLRALRPSKSTKPATTYTAIDYLKNAEVSALLLDLQMPETDGFDVLSYVQAHRRALPVLLLSGMPVDQIQHKMHKLPTHELPPLFLKPIDPHQLVEVLEMQLAGTLPNPTDAQPPSPPQS